MLFQIAKFIHYAHEHQHPYLSESIYCIYVINFFLHMIKNGLRYWGYAATVFALHLGKMGTLVTTDVNTVKRVKGYRR